MTAALVLLTFSSGLVIVLNYLFHLTFARLLPLEIYGQLGWFLAAFMLAALPLSALGQQVTSELATSRDAHALFHKWIRKTVLGGGAFFVVGLLLVKPAVLWFPQQFVSSWHALMLVGALLGNLAFTTVLGAQYGIRDFKGGALSNLAQAFFKIALGLVLLMLSRSSASVVAGLGGASLLSAAWAFWRTEKFFHSTTATTPRSESLTAPPALVPKLWNTVLMSISWAILTNMDVLLAGALLTPQDLGRFTGASAIAKLLVYLPAAIAPVILAQDLITSPRKVFVQSLLFSGAVSALLLLALSLFSKRVLPLVFGPGFAAFSDLMLPYALAAAPLGLVQLCQNVFLRFGRGYESKLFVGLSLAALGILARAAHTPTQLIIGVGATSCGTLALGVALGWRACARVKPL